MQISFVMLSFPLFSDQILGGEVSEEGKLLEGVSPMPPVVTLRAINTGILNDSGKITPG